MNRVISKTRYCKGALCPKILWMDEQMPMVAKKDDSSTTMEQGILVGELAREYFGEYSLVSRKPNYAAMVEETGQMMEHGTTCIAEASFLYDGLFCSVDMLRKTAFGYDIIEVKSTTEVKDEHLVDVGFQYYVLQKSGIPIDHVYVMYLNNQYSRRGELDLRGLFVLDDCTERAKVKQCSVEEDLRRIREALLSEEEPDIELDICCERPHECAYFDYCKRDFPKPSVLDLRNLRDKKEKYELYHRRIISFEDIIKQRPGLKDKPMMQVETAYYHRPPHIERKMIQQFLDTLTYPIYHLDFESFQVVIPEYDDAKPYEQIPFQYSLHIEHEDGTLEHKEYLAEAGKDPRREISERLVQDIPADACVLAYNMSFEKGRIKRLAELNVDLSEHLMKIYGNIRDLMIPFYKQQYYSEAMQGSYSIKYVLPALFPDDPSLDYHNLDGVHNGTEASAAFVNMTKFPPEEVTKMRENLLKYCGLDTYAMVKVLGKLREAVEKE